MLHNPLEFENGLAIDSLVDSRAYINSIAQNGSDRIIQRTPGNIFNIEDPPNSQIQVANDQLEIS